MREAGLAALADMPIMPRAWRLSRRLPDRVSLADAGLAVLADMLITTHFMTLVMLTIWRLPLVLVAAFYFVFTPIEATYWSSTLEKVPTGAPPHLCTPMHRIALTTVVTASCLSLCSRSVSSD